MTWKIKLPLGLITIIFAIYSILWFKATSDITNDLNKKLSNNMLNVTQSHRVQFSYATVSGFPFSVGVKLHDVVEDTSKALIHHKAPVFVGYNIFNQELFMHYNGESIIDAKPLKDKKVMISKGEFRYSIHMPISWNDLHNKINEPNINEQHNLDILSNIQTVSIKIKDASLKDITGKKDIVENTNIDLTLAVKHHRKYQNLVELMQDIPQNYDIDLNIANESREDRTDTVSLSLIYGIYIPFDLKYNLKTSWYTGAKTFSTDDLLSDIQLKSWESSISNILEESSSKIHFTANVSKTNIKCDFESATNIKIKPGYSEQLNKSLKTLVGGLPSAAIGPAKSAINQLDLASLNLDSKNDPVSIDLKFNANLTEKPFLFVLDMPRFGISFHDIGFDIKNSTNAHIEDSVSTWTSSGVISIREYVTLAQYLIDNYFALYHLPQNGEFNSPFYLAVFKDFMHKIANDVNIANSTITVDYALQSLDMVKSKLGKFTWPEVTILYYSELLKHVNAISKDPDEAMTKFKTIVPDYILQPEALDKIIVQSKE